MNNTHSSSSKAVKLSAVVEVPSEPGCPLVVSQSEHGLVLIWDPPLCDGGCPVLHYVVEMREMRGPRWVRVQKTIVAAPPHTVLDLTDGSQYQFCIYACNFLGVGPPSLVSKIVTCKESGEFLIGDTCTGVLMAGRCAFAPWFRTDSCLRYPRKVI